MPRLLVHNEIPGILYSPALVNCIKVKILNILYIHTLPLLQPQACL